jgi:hypothetical protein
MRKWTRIIITVAAVGALVAAIAYAVDHYRKVTQPSAIDPCIANLKMIAGATEMWAAEHHKTTNDIPTWAELVGPSGHFTTQPACQLGGTYTLRPVGQRPTCTVPGHSF